MIAANITAAVLQVAVISVLCLTATVGHPIRDDAIRFVFYDELWVFFLLFEVSSVVQCYLFASHCRSEPLTPFDTDEATTIDCSPDDKLAIIVHGWHEGCFTPWIPMLVKSWYIRKFIYIHIISIDDPYFWQICEFSEADALSAWTTAIMHSIRTTNYSVNSMASPMSWRTAWNSSGRTVCSRSGHMCLASVSGRNWFWRLAVVSAKSAFIRLTVWME